MKLTGKNILVTGGAGFIGSHLVDALIQEGCHVRVIDNLANGKIENVSRHETNPHFHFIKGDITERESLTKAMEDVEIVFHLACLGVRHSIKYPYENHRVNAEGTLLALQAASTTRVAKFVYCSSSEVYGTARSVPMTETHPTYPCTVYGASKLAGEAYARAYFQTYEFPAVIIRPFNTYGPRSHYEGNAGELIPKSIIRILSGQPILIFGDGAQTRDFTYVEDMARALLESAKCDELIGGTFNVGSHFEISIKDIAKKIIALCGISASRMEHVQTRPGDVLRLFADAKGFSGHTGWMPAISLEDGLKRTIDWFRAEPDKLSAMMRDERGFNWE